ncbi:MAG: hypothetical protein JW734_07770 [Candidatus Omnitrophica bacterium]|nr:hypothetical protein [Candidatus Omnitrophota bacterium]
MSNHKNKSVLSVENFVFQGEGLWNESDDFLRELAIAELDKTGLVRKDMVENTWVVRQTKAYPIIYVGFQEHYELLKSKANQFNNFCMIGRGGHKHNNQDHSIMSGILASCNYLGLKGSPYNLWDISLDD